MKMNINLSKEEIIDSLNKFRSKYQINNNQELEENDICYLSAIIREVSSRTLGLRHYDFKS